MWLPWGFRSRPKYGLEMISQCCVIFCRLTREQFLGLWRFRAEIQVFVMQSISVYARVNTLTIKPCLQLAAFTRNYVML